MTALNQYCRLCLSKDSVVVRLYENGGDDNDCPLYMKVVHCVAIKVHCDDGLPVLVCQACADRVKEFWCFREKCEMIDMSLRKLLRENKSKLDGDLVNDIKSLAQASERAFSREKRSRKKIASRVLPLPSSIERESERDTQVSEPLVKLEAVHRDEDDTWPQSSPMSPSTTSKRSEKKQDGKETPVDKKQYFKRKKSEYICEFCGRIFPRSNHLAQHELTHTAEKPFHCSDCNKSFWYKASLIGHIKQTHTGDVNYTCDLCGKGFFKKTELTRHKPTHSNETPHKCPQCGMGFKITKTLKRHIRNVHTAQRSHTCHTCGKSFTQLQTLKVHLVLHSGVKPYVCSYCGKGFSQSAPLKTHIRIHTGERPYSCHACGDSFPTRSALTSHAVKHTGTLPYPCTRCPSTFRLKRDLIQHEQGHDDEESRSGQSNLIHLEIERSADKEENHQIHDEHILPHNPDELTDVIGQSSDQNHSNTNTSPNALSVVPYQIPASHTVGRPNPPMFHQQQLRVENSPAPLSEQKYPQNIVPKPSNAHIVSHNQTHISINSQVDEGIDQHTQRTSHSPSRSLLNATLQPNSQLSDLF